MTAATMKIEHDAQNIHLSTRMEDASHHPYRVAMTDGGAAIIMPEDNTWIQSVVLHGMPMEMLNDSAMMSRMLGACWTMAECCRDGMNEMRMTGSTTSGSTGMSGQMATIVCGSCTINVTL